jgi:GWxTD domain-containing protein
VTRIEKLRADLPLVAGGAARVLVAGALLFCLVSCGGGRGAEDATAGRTLSFTPGVPDFDLEVVPFWGGGESGVTLYLALPRSSLTFVLDGAMFVAQFEVTALFREPDTRTLVQDNVWADTLAVSTYGETQLLSTVSPTKRFHVPPGTYSVEVILRDRNSGAEARRTRRATVLEPDRQTPALGRFLIERQIAGEKFEPLLGFQVPTSDDSLRIISEIYRLREGDTAAVALLVVRLRTDTSVATPPYAFSRMAITGSQTLVNLMRADTVFAAGVRVRGSGEKISFYYYLPPLNQGLFRVLLKVRAPVQEREDTVLEQRKYMLFLSPGFPRPSTFDEMLRAAGYLARRDEVITGLTGVPEDSLRRLFESFWLGLAGGDRQAGRDLIRRYYTRIEEANKYFTTYKEGWKTDRGMVFTILGPPPMVEKSYDTETWYYDQSGSYAANRYQFRRIYVTSDELMLEDYLLTRTSGYESFWSDMVSRWRRGAAF